MKVITRCFAFLLLSVFLLVGLSLAGSWALRSHLNPVSAIKAHLAADPSLSAEEAQARADEILTVRLWTTIFQTASLALCGIVCGLGLYIRYRAGREASARETAERELDRERRALERRIEDRTRELRQEVEERRRAEEFNRGQKQVLEMLASPYEQKTEHILRRLTATVAAQRRSWECSIHLVDGDGKTLRLVASSEVSERLERYLENIGADFPDAPESRACASGEKHIVERMTDVRRPWSELLVANGILSTWSVPFRTDAAGKVAGTLTVYHRLQNSPTERDLELIETAANLASLVIAHRRIHDELVHNAYQDALTTLPNRRAGELSIAAAIQEARKLHENVGVLWIDLNRFKRINDQYGHNAGDEVLRAVAARLRDCSLINGGVARMGGDEFLALIRGEEASGDLAALARQLEGVIAEPISLGATPVSISGSIGVCVYPQDGEAIDILERNADSAMYRAKAAGAGTCLYSPAMTAEVKEALEIEEALGFALERNQLKLLYQPIYHADGRLYAFEALLRFQHPTLGNISPARFIPIAEETRLIVPIGNWVLREACNQLKTWHGMGLPLARVAVNISAVQFVRDDFAESVAAMLAECELSPEHLTLELTESVVMEDYSSVVRQMSLLKQCGIRIAMDDFGTGYSSLSYIHKLPIDVLKIDRSFIERIADPEGTRPIVEAVISMCRYLGLNIIAEGVETEEQRSILHQAGCKAFQGYHFSKPVPPTEAESLLRFNEPFWTGERCGAVPVA